MAVTPPRKSAAVRKVAAVRKPTAALNSSTDTVTKSTPRSSTTTTTTGEYVLPFIHTHVPAPIVQVGFWGGLAATVAFGVIEAPLAAAVGVGVLVARHRRSS